MWGPRGQKVRNSEHNYADLWAITFQTGWGWECSDPEGDSEILIKTQDKRPSPYKRIQQEPYHNQNGHKVCQEDE